MESPLKGVKVLELTQFLMGPRAGAHLADMGADVIKIEDLTGEPMRGAIGGSLPKPTDNFNYGFELQNRGKKGITIDLSKPKGQEAIHKLIKTTDVFLTNVRPKVLQKFKLDYETLDKVNPRLIYALGTGWGTRGPDKDLPGFDYTVFARAGLMATMGEPGTPPVTNQAGLGDHYSAITLCYAIMLALYHREKSGKGQMVHASIYGCMVDAGALVIQSMLSTKLGVLRRSRKDMDNPLTNFYETKDGRWIQFFMPHSDRFWHEFCRVFGLEKYETDPKFADFFARKKNFMELTDAIERAMASKTLNEWKGIFSSSSVVWAPVTTYPELLEDPQLWANQHVVEVEDPRWGKVQEVGIPITLSKTPGKVRACAPDLGQNTEEVLLELGYSWDDIGSLKSEGVIG